MQMTKIHVEREIHVSSSNADRDKLLKTDNGVGATELFHGFLNKTA